MRGIDRIAACAPLEPALYPGTKALELHNIERVRSYLEKNVGCMQIEVVRALNLNKRTVSKAIKIIRGKV